MADTIGAHRPDMYRGWLVFEGLPDELQRAEDATQAFDVELANDDGKRWRYRPATDTEKVLLEHLGYTITNPPKRRGVPDDGALYTRVQWRHGTLRHRSWPQLEPDPDAQD